jgi:exosortase E/protease (VPEID-CTERM system)
VLAEVAEKTNSLGTASLPLPRWPGFLIVLFVELALLAFLFDPGVLAGRSHFHAVVVQRYPVALRVGIAAIVATLFFGWSRLRAEVETNKDEVRSRANVGVLFCLHLLAFCSLAALTAFVLGKGARFSAHPEAWIGLWASIGVLWLATWCVAVLPAKRWLLILQRCRWVFLGGLAVGLAAGMAGWLTDQLWQPLSRGTFWIVHQLLLLTGAEAVYDPSAFLLGTSNFSVAIEPACSGYEGIGLVWVFLATYLWVERHQLRFPHVLILFPIGTLVIWVANALRIFALIIVGSRVSPRLAEDGFHTQAGWLAFVAIALAIVVVTQRFGLFATKDRAQSLASARTPAPYLVPFLAGVAFAMVSAATCEGVDYLYPARVIAVAGALWFYRRDYAGLGWAPSWTAVPVGALVAVIWIAMAPVGAESSAAKSMAGIDNMPALASGAWFGLRLLGYVALVPIAEELAFRAYLMRQLVAADFESVALGRFTWFSLLGTSLVFGVLHERWLAGSLAGLAYGLLLCRRGRIGDCVLAHATTNGLLALYVLVTGHWSLLS